MPISRISTARQHGSVLVQFACMLGVLLAVLGLVDVGYMYYAKRDLQRNADLAALHAVQYIDHVGPSATQRIQSCQQAGNNSIQANWPSVSPVTVIAQTVRCGEWDAQRYAAPMHFQAGGEVINAAQVTLQGRSPTFFPAPLNRNLTATAVAKRGVPLAVFSVGSKLVAVGCAQQLAPLVQILKLVGTGNPCITLNGYEGVVNATISASGLLAALGLPLDANLSIADVNSLLAARKVSLGQVLDAAATLAGQQQLLGANAQLLNTLSARLGLDALNVQIPLGSGPNGPGIFASITAPDTAKATALDVQVGVLDVIAAAVGVATTGRGVAVPGVSVQVPGILPNLLQVRAGLTEPPSIAIGGVGATAYNAQIRLYINIDTTGGLVGGLLQLLGTQVKLPIYIDITRAKATLEELSCRAPVRDSTARIRVHSSIAQACVGRVSGDPFSIRTPICDSVTNETLISALGLIRVHNRILIDVLQHNELSPPIKVGETWTTGNLLNLGTTLSHVVNELLRLLGELLGAPTSTAGAAADPSSVTALANYYLGKAGSTTHPQGALPKQTLGLLGPSGAYNVSALAERLKADIDRTSQSCLLLPILCWQTNEWDTWANNVQSGNIASQQACWGSTPEGNVVAGVGGSSADVARFNSCVERELREALLESPSQRPNYLQVLLSPLTDLLKNLLDPLGNLLAGPILRDTLGIELGLADVHLRSVGCGNGALVY